MKYLIPLLSLFIICFPGKILGEKIQNFPNPVQGIIEKSYQPDCHLKGTHHECKVLLDYIIKVAGNINTELRHNSKQENILTPMCRNETTLRSTTGNLVKKMCDLKAPQDDIVQKIIDETCNIVVLQVIGCWHLHKGIRFNMTAFQ